MIALLLLALILLGSLSESSAAWSARYVNPLEVFAALLFVAVLVFVFGPVIESIETGLALMDWIDGGMR